MGSGEVKPMEGKVSAIRNFKRPIMKKDVRSFLVMCGYYLKLIKVISTVANPLTSLTRKYLENKME